MNLKATKHISVGSSNSPSQHNTSTPTNSSKNLIPELTSNINIFVIIVFIIFVILTFIALFSPSTLFTTNKMTLTDDKIIANVLVIFSFVIVLLGLLIMFLPSLSDLKQFIIQFKQVVIVIFYTIFLILLYRLTPSNIMDKYSFIITPITMVLSIFLIYKGFKKNYLKEFNINYERIKTVILFLCFLTIFFVYYTCNTGGFVQYYFGPTFLITLLIGVFAFLYVIIVLALPENTSGTKPGLNSSNFFSNFSKFSVWGSFAFFIYIIISVIGFMYLNGNFNKNPKGTTKINNNNTSGTTYSDSKTTDTLSLSQLDSNISSVFNSVADNPNGVFLDLTFLKVGGDEHKIEIPILPTFLDKQNVTEGFTQNETTKNGSLTLAIIFILITTIIFGTTLIINIFPESVEYFQTNTVSDINKLSLLKRTLLILFGIVISGLLIVWIVYYIQTLSYQNGFVSFILNLLLVIVILTLLYRIIIVKTPSANNNNSSPHKSAFFSLLINLVLYIPCIFSGLFESIVEIFTGKKYSTNTISILLIIFAIILFIVYSKLPSIDETIALQGGQLIVNRPIQTINSTPLATYTELNGNNDLKYEFGFSFWFYIDAMPPSSNPSYNTYTSILNYGNKPNITYNASDNILRITMEKIDRKPYSSGLPGNKKEFSDTTIQEVVYEHKGILLQKWNNIIINYSGGTLDIFLNNDLMKSVNGIVPYMVNEPLTIGSENGLLGGVCTVVYFKKPLTATQMFYLYNIVKDKTPPITNESIKTIISNKSIISTVN